MSFKPDKFLVSPSMMKDIEEYFTHVPVTPSKIDKKLYYKHEILIVKEKHYRAIFYSMDDIPPAASDTSATRIRDMATELKANKPYAVWYGNEIFDKLPWV